MHYILNVESVLFIPFYYVPNHRHGLGSQTLSHITRKDFGSHIKVRLVLSVSQR